MDLFLFSALFLALGVVLGARFAVASRAIDDRIAQFDRDTQVLATAEDAFDDWDEA